MIRSQLSDDFAIRLTGVPKPEPSAPICPKAGIHILQTATSFTFFSPSCRRWKCEFCLPHLLWKWAIHLASIVMDQPSDPRYDFVCDAEWPALRKTITRKRGSRGGSEFMRIGGHVISDRKVSANDPAFTWRETACAIIGRAILEIEPPEDGPRFRPVTTSLPWGFPKRPKSHSKHFGMIRSGVPLQNVRDMVNSMNLPAATGERGDLVRLHESVSKKTVEEIMRRLQAIPRPRPAEVRVKLW